VPRDRKGPPVSLSPTTKSFRVGDLWWNLKRAQGNRNTKCLSPVLFLVIHLLSSSSLLSTWQMYRLVNAQVYKWQHGGLSSLKKKKYHDTARFISDPETGIYVWNSGGSPTPTLTQRCSQSSSPAKRGGRLHGREGSGQGRIHTLSILIPWKIRSPWRVCAAQFPFNNLPKSDKSNWYCSVFISLQGQVMRSQGHQELAKNTFQTLNEAQIQTHHT